MRLRWRQVRRLLRWHSVLFPLAAAALTALATLLPILNGGNRWCNTSSYTCSVGTNLLGVVFVAGLTSYWYYGFRRALLLSRHRRTVLARLARDRVAGEALAHDPVRDAIAATVLSRYRDWRSQPPVLVIAGLPGSGKTALLADVVRRLASARTWYVPVPLDDLAGGGEQDVLDAAQRQLNVMLHDASINPSLIESLGRSLIQSRRLMIVIDDIDRIGPALSSYERALVVQRLMSSAQRLDVPLLATARSGSVEWLAGSVIELPPRSAEFVLSRIDQAPAVPAELKQLVHPALTGSLATPIMIDRVVTLMRRERDQLAAALTAEATEVADLVVWRHLLTACQPPGAVLTERGLELVAYVLLITGQREIAVGGSPDWQQALRFGRDVDVHLPAHHVGADEVAAYVDGGFLDSDSSPFDACSFRLRRCRQSWRGSSWFRQPELVAAIVAHLGTTGAARMALADALRYDNKQ